MSGGRRARLLQVAVVVGVVVVAALVLRSEVWGDGDAGDVQQAADRELPGVAHSYVVEVPTGTVVLRVAPPVDRLDAALVGGEAGDERLAGPGRSFVGVAWSLDLESLVAVDADDELVAATTTSIVLAAGDDRIELGSIASDPLAEPQAMYATVAGGDLAVEVTFDGLTQRVDLDSGEIDAGLASPLYEPDRLAVGDGDCAARGTVEDGLSSNQFECRVSDVVLEPWREGLGWVEEPGSSWATVGVSTSATAVVASLPSGKVAYTPTTADHELMLDGAAPVESDLVVDNGEVDQGAFVDGQVTWLIDGEDPTALEVRQNLVLEPRYGGGRQRSLTVSTTVELAPLR